MVTFSDILYHKQLCLNEHIMVTCHNNFIDKLHIKQLSLRHNIIKHIKSTLILLFARIVKPTISSFSLYDFPPHSLSVLLLFFAPSPVTLYISAGETSKLEYSKSGLTNILYSLKFLTKLTFFLQVLMVLLISPSL